MNQRTFLTTKRSKNLDKTKPLPGVLSGLRILFIMCGGQPKLAAPCDELWEEGLFWLDSFGSFLI